MANAGDNTVSVLLNRGNGTFQTRYPMPPVRGPLLWLRPIGTGTASQTSPSPMAGLLSMVLARAWFPSCLTMAMAPLPTRLTTRAVHIPISVVAARFRGDGKLDLALATNLDIYGRVSILDGNGDGTFQSNVDYEGGFGIYSLVAADFNGDGKPDLAVVSNLNDTMFLLTPDWRRTVSLTGHLWNRQRARRQLRRVNFTRKPAALGGADVVVANVASGSISVFLNIPWHKLQP